MDPLRTDYELLYEKSRMSNSEKFLGFVLFMGIIGVILAVCLSIVKFLPTNLDTYDPERDCAVAYGKEYHFVEGDRSPDLCVTKDGKVRYYDLIK